MLDFLRDVGKHITVNQMMAKESVRARLEGDAASPTPSSATCSCRPTTSGTCTSTTGCELQMGGSDQWGNIIAGIDLIRRTTGAAGATGSRGRCCCAATAASSASRPAARCGSTPSAPPRTSSASTGCRPTTRWSTNQLLWFSTRPLDEVRAMIAEHAAAPERRVGQRALAPTS